MRIAMTLAAAMLALATSTPSASAQRSSGGGTIGCDPGAPTHQVSATSCRIFFQESLYGPAANPYVASWGPRYIGTPVLRDRTDIYRQRARSTRKSGESYGASR
jgi:hypothetical protein